MTTPSKKQLLSVATRAARAAGNHALTNKHRRTEVNETFDHDIKLVLDLECQKIAEAVILATFPDHAILGEEDETPNTNSPYEWIIDPIDGTMNYSHSFEYWCSSVAVRHKNQLIAGTVFAPEFGTTYSTDNESPATCNGNPIRVSPTTKLNQAMIFTGLSKWMEKSTEPHLQFFNSLALKTKKLRINGAAALDLCRVADGTCDGFFETGIYLWDYAAAGLIAQQAGAEIIIIPRPNDPHGATVLCANPHLISGLQTIHSNGAKNS